MASYETRPCTQCGKPITRLSSQFRTPTVFCCRQHAAQWATTLRDTIKGPTAPGQLPPQTFAITDLKPWGGPNADAWARRVAHEQQRAAEWMALRGAVALKALIEAAYPAEAA